ncbi:MAG TPA: hypothetical protein VJM49_20240 [Acidimicrobiales bacterium]|nr:hypothetical protein [Acidimicrobiales bacterium]
MSVVHDGSGSIRRLADGSTEEAGWLEVDGERVFQVTRVPAGEVSAWLLLCSAIGGEHDGGYRRQTMLARRLAGDGVATRRFHYRGTANSHIHTTTVRDTMIADAIAAGRDLAERFPSATGIVLGERVGALVAAEVVGVLGARDLVLWHPVCEIETYHRELSRAAKLQKVTSGIEAAGDAGAADFAATYDQGEGDLIGFAAPRALIESFEGHPLAESHPGADCAVHLVQFGRKRLDPRFEKLLAAWGDAGTVAESHLLSEPELWWFAPGPWKRGEELRPVTVEALSVTVPIVQHIAAAEAVAS